jgi:MATE family multidrug resistance protein
MAFSIPALRQHKLFSAFRNLAKGSKYFAEIWRVGWPLGAMFSIEVGAFFTFTFLMSLFGTDALAAFQLTRQYLVFALVTLFALTESSAVRVSHAVGERDRMLIRQRYHVSIGLTIVFMLTLSCIYLSSKNFLISLDLNMNNPDNRNIIFYTKHFLTAVAVLVLFDGIRNVTAGALRGLKDTKSNMYSSILGYWIIGLPLAFLFGKIWNLGGEGLWVGFILGIAVSAIYLFVRFQKLSARVDFNSLLSLFPR